MSHPSTPRPDPELAEIWRARLDKAKASYDVAVAEFRRLSEEYKARDLPLGDAGFALRRAIQVENDARQRYAKVLQEFTELVVNGKLPPED
jgi:hypothetical protein